MRKKNLLLLFTCFLLFTNISFATHKRVPSDTPFIFKLSDSLLITIMNEFVELYDFLPVRLTCKNFQNGYLNTLQNFNPNILFILKKRIKLSGYNIIEHFILGRFYHSGILTPIDLTVAIKHYIEAARKNHISAIYYLANVYNYDFDNRLNPEFDNKFAARRLYSRAIEQGDIDSMFELGRLYELGEGGNPDIMKAIDYYKIAAEAGHTNAQYRLAIIYQNNGDMRDAIHWFYQSAINGRLEAYDKLKNVYTQLFDAALIQDPNSASLINFDRFLKLEHISLEQQSLGTNAINMIKIPIKELFMRKKLRKVMRVQKLLSLLNKKIILNKMKKKVLFKKVVRIANSTRHPEPNSFIPNTLPEGAKHSPYYGNTAYDGAMSIKDILRFDKMYYSQKAYTKALTRNSPQLKMQPFKEAPMKPPIGITGCSMY